MKMGDSLYINGRRRWLGFLFCLVTTNVWQHKLCEGWSSTLIMSKILTLSSPPTFGYIGNRHGAKGNKGQGMRSGRRSLLKMQQLGPDNLSSTYDRMLPATLRGEAVRSALRSDRGVCYDFSSPFDKKMTERNVQVLRVQGKGTVSFLNSKFTCAFAQKGNKSNLIQQTCLLNRKGSIMDVITVLLFANSSGDEEAILITSPGNDSLYDQLEPLIFPMDQVTLTKMNRARVFMVGTANPDIASFQRSMQQFISPFLMTKELPGDSNNDLISFPSTDNNVFTSGIYPQQGNDSSTLQWMVLPQTFLPSCAAKGYTLLLLPENDGQNDNDNANIVADRIWNTLIAEDNMQGPVHLGPLEYETLRIEAGQPAFGHEMSPLSEDGKTKISPTELYFHQFPVTHLLKDVTTKGCFLGQEAVSASLGNPRGPPRSLYSLVFEHEDNTYEFQSDQGPNYSTPTSDTLDNLTRLPQVGDKLYVLGSNEQISIGSITSVAEMGGTSNDEVVCLALIKRADSIRKQMKSMDLQEWDPYFDITDRNTDPFDIENDDHTIGSGMLPPPPRDPLHGLEVIIGGSMTHGTLRVLPWRKFVKADQNMFQEGTWDTDNTQYWEDETSSVMSVVPPETLKDEARDFAAQQQSAVPYETFPSDKNDENELNVEQHEVTEFSVDDEDMMKTTLEQAEKEAQAAAAEAKRKEEKLKILQERAKAAMEARRQKQKTAKDAEKNLDNTQNDTDAKEAEAKRKAEKIEMLRKRAQAAMEARKKKNQ